MRIYVTMFDVPNYDCGSHNKVTVDVTGDESPDDFINMVLAAAGIDRGCAPKWALFAGGSSSSIEINRTIAGIHCCERCHISAIWPETTGACSSGAENQ